MFIFDYQTSCILLIIIHLLEQIRANFINVETLEESLKKDF